MKHKKLFGTIVLAILAFYISGCDYSPFKSKYQKIREKHIAGMYKETIPILEDWVNKNPDSAETHLLLATALLNGNGDFDSSARRFNSALKLQKDEMSKTLMRRSIGEKYKNALINFLEAGKSGTKYLFERMLKFADKATLSLVENHLSIFCNNYMNERGYSQAYNGYKYLAKLNPLLNKKIGQKYLMLFNEITDQKLKTRIIEDALKFSREDLITKAYSEYHYGLSKQASTTKEVIAELKIANRFGGLYVSEFRAKQEQLKQEQFLALVKKYEAKWGPAKKVELTEVGEWIPVCTIKNRQRINYLSKHKFKEKDNTNRENVWKKAVNKKYSYRLSGSREIHVEFKMFKKSTNVYYWTSDS